MQRTIESMCNLVINGITEHKNLFTTDTIKQANEVIGEIKGNKLYNIQSFDLLKPILVNVLNTVK